MEVILSQKFLSYDEAAAKVGQPCTCFEFLTHRKHISLSPKHIGQISEGVKEILKLDLNHYSQCMEGIPIAYRKPRYVQRCGTIMDESPYIHIDVEADYVIFQPKMGSRLKGIVNKLGSDHISCLVHGIFNASIYLPHNNNEANLIKSKLEGNMEVEFEVTELKTRSGIVSVCGKNPSGSSYKKRKRSEIGDDSADGIGEALLHEMDATISASSKNKKRKKSKKKELSAMSDRNSLDTDNNDNSLDMVACNAISNDIPTSTVSVVVSNDNNKKTKKRKHINAEVNLESSFETISSCVISSDSERKKHKKKKKSKDIDCLENIKAEPRTSLMASVKLESSQTNDLNHTSKSSCSNELKHTEEIKKEDSSCKEHSLDLSTDVNTSAKKKKKKNKKQKEVEMDIEQSIKQEIVIKNEIVRSSDLNLGINETDSGINSNIKIETDQSFGINNVNVESKKSKKHKKKKKSIKQECESP